MIALLVVSYDSRDGTTAVRIRAWRRPGTNANNATSTAEEQTRTTASTPTRLGPLWTCISSAVNLPIPFSGGKLVAY